MKKIILTVVFAFAFNTINAQVDTTKTKSVEFNRWSVELAGGGNKVNSNMSKGYYTAEPGFFTVNLGARYMLNNKFGLKADVEYNNLEAGYESKDFNTQYYRFDIQAVANLGRIMDFQTFTKTIGLLAHTGFGGGYLDGDNFKEGDQVGNFIAGLTVQAKLSDKFALTGDITSIHNSRQKYTFNGGESPDRLGFESHLLNATIGLTYYLGSNAKHADWDWAPVDKETEDKIAELEKKIADLETLSNDSDRDGVVDYLDVEPNSIGGVMVDTKGRSIDNNNNGIPDELENYMTQKYGDTENSSLGANTNNQMIKNLINGGYNATYFDSGKSTPTNVSTEGIDFILTYLRNNPTASVDIIGHADEIGKSEQNDKLSNARANSVKNILLKAKIDPSRLNVVPAGEDDSVDKDSDGARKLVRRVTFRVK